LARARGGWGSGIVFPDPKTGKSSWEDGRASLARQRAFGKKSIGSVFFIVTPNRCRLAASALHEWHVNELSVKNPAPCQVADSAVIGSVFYRDADGRRWAPLRIVRADPFQPLIMECSASSHVASRWVRGAAARALRGRLERQPARLTLEVTTIDDRRCSYQKCNCCRFGNYALARGCSYQKGHGDLFGNYAPPAGRSGRLRR
jgi:hypothetical protein